MSENERRRHVVIGTAGHIDHGKTSLIKALTGRDLDKLAEEKRRGITIELGFAFYGDSAAFVDVPGHEKLVKTMIAGASAMSAAMLVIAADDGVMPQTREHLTVLDALGVKRGIVAISKADLVEEDWLDLVIEEARELMEGTALAGSPVLAVDSLSGRGIDEFRAELDKLIAETPPPSEEDFFRLPIDRSFVIKGHGRVVTGTVWNGSAKAGDKLRLLPGDQDVKVRGLQAHEQPVDTVFAGDRAALNLTTDAEPERGQLLVNAGRGVVTDFLDVAVTMAPDARPLKQRARIRLHLGTAEVIGRLLLIDREFLQPEERADVRLALEEPVVAMHGDLGVLRFYSPTDTLGGVRVLDPAPVNRKRSASKLAERLAALHQDPNVVLSTLLETRKLMTIPELLAMLPVSRAELDHTIRELVAEESLLLVESIETLLPVSVYNRWRDAIPEHVAAYHHSTPNDPGMPEPVLGMEVFGPSVPYEIADNLLNELVDSHKLIRESGYVLLPGHVPAIAKPDQADADRILSLLVDAGMNPPVPSKIAEDLGIAETRVRALLKALKNIGRVVILEDKLVLAKVSVNMASFKLNELPEEFRLTEFNAAVGTSRKVGVPLLEWFDKQGITQRDGDVRRVMDTGDSSS
ncbi:selenocysteine-specific translation elongation factor [bacterium]|nr:selenocysteine-specific translation elongation factor [bacterium]